MRVYPVLTTWDICSQQRDFRSCSTHTFSCREVSKQRLAFFSLSCYTTEEGQEELKRRVFSK